MELHVEIRDADAGLASDWRDLVAGAPANVFVDPVGLRAVRDSGFAKPFLLLAWDRATSPARLVGIMALRVQRTFGLRHLCTLPHDYAFISSPVIDSNHADAVMAAFVAEIAHRRDLPNVIRLQYLDGDEPSYEAVRSALAGRATQSLVLSNRERAYATRGSGIKRSGSTRKKLRQDWSRLSAAGTAAIVNQRSEADVRAALEVFLALEAASWKGAEGTAFLSNERDTAFARAFVIALAAAGSASVALLHLDGRPIAAQVLLYAGSKAYTWKIAYDAGFARFSPGALLVDKVAEMLFDGGSVTEIESCSPDGGFMDRMWDGRRPTVDLLVELAPRKSPTFHAIAAAVRARNRLRDLRRRLHGIDWPWQRGKSAPVAPAENTAKS